MKFIFSHAMNIANEFFQLSLVEIETAYLPIKTKTL